MIGIGESTKAILTDMTNSSRRLICCVKYNVILCMRTSCFTLRPSSMTECFYLLNIGKLLNYICVLLVRLLQVPSSNFNCIYRNILYYGHILIAYQFASSNYKSTSVFNDNFVIEMCSGNDNIGSKLIKIQILAVNK